MADWIAFGIPSTRSTSTPPSRRALPHDRAGRPRASYRTGAAVLDYGCGEALSADIMAATARTPDPVRGGAEVCATPSPPLRGPPEDRIRVARGGRGIAGRPLDAIVHAFGSRSISRRRGSTRCSQLFRRRLTGQGILVLGDVLPPNVSVFTDAMALIRFAAANGFLAAALVGFCRTLLSDYWRLRLSLGLSRYGEAAMVESSPPPGLRPPRGRQYRPQPCPHDVSGKADGDLSFAIR